MRMWTAAALAFVYVAGCATPPGSSSVDGLGNAAAGGSGGINRADQRDKPYVVMISFDGFRADYFDWYPAPNFNRLAARGVIADGLIPVFPSKTFPNHYAIATGLTAEHSGIVSNSFWDPERGARYTIGDAKVTQDGTWYRGEPIWVTAERQGMVTASYFWVGSEAAIGGVRPTFWKTYDEKVANDARVDSVLSWLALPEERRPHLITLYMSEVDDAGHRHGPDSPEVASAILTVDASLGRLMNGIARLPVAARTFLVLVSDHGMSSHSPAAYQAVDRMIDTSGVQFGDAGPVTALFVTGGSKRAAVLRDSLNRKLKGGRAYLRQDMPERFHYRADPRIGDIVVVMEEHATAGQAARAPRGPGGSHGWDPALPSMRGIFLIAGPGIAAQARMPAFRNVHIYPLLTELLGLRAAAGIDGQADYLRSRVMAR